mmetsp:Transcript_4544/g.6010  ORF Transcript_4544/g.6010 Transcript_4544/m.6010 type:complete len:179 (+) Transcript_4544:39-575(+)
MAEERNNSSNLSPMSSGGVASRQSSLLKKRVSIQEPVGMNRPLLERMATSFYDRVKETAPPLISIDHSELSDLLRTVLSKVDENSLFVKDAILPIVDDFETIKKNIDKILTEMPEHAQNISVCLSRIKKLNKVSGEKDDKMIAMNKLVSTLFTEVTELLGHNSNKESALEEIKQEVEV